MKHKDAMNADFDKGLQAYEQGDYATAAKCWGPIAKKGHVEAQFYMGVLHSEGTTVSRGYQIAYIWLTMASLNESEQAKEKVKEVEEELFGNEIEDSRDIAKQCLDRIADEHAYCPWCEMRFLETGEE